MPAIFAAATPDAIPVHVIEPAGLPDWIALQDEATANWIAASGFKAVLGAQFR